MYTHIHSHVTPTQMTLADVAKNLAVKKIYNTTYIFHNKTIAPTPLKAQLMSYENNI